MTAMARAAEAELLPETGGMKLPLDSPFRLENDSAYRRWRDEKLQAGRAAAARTVDVVEIGDLAAPTADELQAVLAACRGHNMALYRAPALAGDAAASRRALARFVRRLGLREFEAHRSSGDDGIVPIEVGEAGDKDGFIPYTDRAINWHTDGYYSYRSPERMIRSMVLHCVRDAAEGGENALLDQDIAYIRLRDAAPAFIAALMHPEAMTIPAFEDSAGEGHAAVPGPVFIVREGALTMRFTIRKRNIVWREDPVLAEALQALAGILENDPLIVRRRLAPDEGLVCNNVLHNRAAFANGPAQEAGRLLLRVRCYDRVGGNTGF